MEEQVKVHVVLDMVEKVLDIKEDVRNEYKLNLLMNPLKTLKSVLFAIDHDDPMHLVKNIELVVQHHMYPKRLDIVDQLMNGMLDHCLTLDYYHMQRMVMEPKKN
jgi:hypothetical protein